MVLHPAHLATSRHLATTRCVLPCTNYKGCPDSGSSADPSRPPSPTLEVKKGKKREDFTLKDVDQLLRATIEVNPYAALRNSIGEAWKDVVQKAQAAGYRLGRDVDTCKNHIGLLLGW